jgi:predicted enzyme related to lactoylglutathione lyase
MNMFIFKLGDKEVGGLIETPIGMEESFNTSWMGYVAVEDIHQAVSKAVELGATVILPVKSIGTNGYVSIILDPVGARIGLWQASSEMY